ncbi:MAG: BatD family protein [Bacteroidales bacterium]|nr:BatD family protein [Bacteroidales bacterium]
MKRHLILFILIFGTGSLFADEVKFTGEAPGVVEMGQRFRLTYTINTEAEDFRSPDLQHFTVLAGPSTSSSTNVNIVNGKMTKNYRLQFTYVLQADEAGKFTIPPATVKVDGEIYESNAVQIEVIKNGSSASKKSRQADTEQGSSRAKKAKPSGDDIFVRVLVSKNNVYREEPLVATIKLYSKLNISGLENVDFPNFEGFYKQEIETPSLRQLEKENVNGEIYGTGILKKYLLFPQKTGRLTIQPFEVDCIVKKKVESESRSLFDDFFGSYKNVKMPVSSDPVRINVSPLPSGEPVDFTGGIGSFSLNTSLDKHSVETNEGVTLKIKISGSGNIKVLSPPQINFPPDLEVYDPKTSDNISVSEGGAKGSKVFEYLIIPRHAGEYRIPSISMSYFNPSTGSYNTLQAQPINLNVAKGEGDTTTRISSSSKQEVNIIGSDIRYIQTQKFDLREKGEFLFGSGKFYAVYAGGIAVFFVVFLIRRKKIRENANVAMMKNKKANKFARRRLKVASRYLKEGDKDKFYEETLKALWGYLSDKLGIAVAELSRDKAKEKLSAKQVPENLTEQFIELIDNCEFARYAPSGGGEKMDELYNYSISVISRLQQKLK